MDDQHEEVEHIPWGELMASAGDGRRRAMFLAAGALGALVLGVVITRAVSVPAAPVPEPVPVAVATTTTTLATPVTVLVPAPVPEATTTTTTLPAPVLYREADLMAFPPDWGARTAVARAEWFITGSGI